ncbi:MAG: hypothetical protein JWM95_1914, partial [Gemmatimonadetes bacterium]|nr:hypothetical protein [Gemmatimonadota bacterium]
DQHDAVDDEQDEKKREHSDGRVWETIPVVTF